MEEKKISTHATIIITDGIDRLYFYKHCDGYPDGTLPALLEFLNRIKTERIRNNATQAAGWLVVMGHEESKQASHYPLWKVGAYEPTTGVNQYSEFVYTVHVQELYIAYAHYGNEEEKRVQI